MHLPAAGLGGPELHLDSKAFQELYHRTPGLGKQGVVITGDEQGCPHFQSLSQSRNYKESSQLKSYVIRYACSPASESIFRMTASPNRCDTVSRSTCISFLWAEPTGEGEFVSPFFRGGALVLCRLNLMAMRCCLPWLNAANRAEF
jgi:hypothetical protein